MADMLTNLVVYIAIIGVTWGGGYILWRRITGGP